MPSPPLRDNMPVVTTVPVDSDTAATPTPLEPDTATPVATPATPVPTPVRTEPEKQSEEPSGIRNALSALLSAPRKIMGAVRNRKNRAASAVEPKLKKKKNKKVPKKGRMEFDLPHIAIHAFRPPDPLPAKVKARYRVGLSEVIIAGDEYFISDPVLREEEKAQLEKVASHLLFLMPAAAISDEAIFRKSLEEAGIHNEPLYYLLRREIMGYGVFDVLMQDDRIEDITAWPTSTSVSHKDFGILRTPISMPEHEFDRYIEKFVHMSGKSVSLYTPLLSIRLPNNDRLTVTYGREASSSPSFAIRKFPKQPWAITTLMMMGTLTPEMVGWLMLMIKYKRALLVCGPTGVGKTSLINALCSTIPAEQVVVTVEDTPELRLARHNWFSFLTRESMTVEERGEIRMFDLIRHALRQPADYIIVGEVRGEEGRIWAQAIATGHGGITSLHAESPEGAVERLRAEPINVSAGALHDLSTIIMVKAFLTTREGIRVKVRRVTGIYDLVVCGGKAETVPLFRYDPESDSHMRVSDLMESATVKKITEFVPARSLQEEYRRYVRFATALLRLAPAAPELGAHVKVTELVNQLYATGALPEELRRLEQALLGEG